jgi:hypothetical protein
VLHRIYKINGTPVYTEGIISNSDKIDEALASISTVASVRTNDDAFKAAEDEGTRSAF